MSSGYVEILDVTPVIGFTGRSRFPRLLMSLIPLSLAIAAHKRPEG